MRVIAGSAKRIQLKTPEGFDTRPTTDRIKETLFNMISGRLADSVFLDLFSGSGAIGIEALSRGASNAVFVESNSKTATYIRENLRVTRLEGRAEVIVTDAISALSKMEGVRQFDYIFMDPPYEQLAEKEVLEYLATSNIPSEDALFIIEASLDTEFSYVTELGYEMIKEKCYKTNKHVFLERVSK